MFLVLAVTSCRWTIYRILQSLHAKIQICSFVNFALAEAFVPLEVSTHPPCTLGALSPRVCKKEKNDQLSQDDNNDKRVVAGGKKSLGLVDGKKYHCGTALAIEGSKHAKHPIPHVQCIKENCNLHGCSFFSKH